MPVKLRRSLVLALDPSCLKLNWLILTRILPEYSIIFELMLLACCLVGQWDFIETSPSKFLLIESQ